MSGVGVSIVLEILKIADSIILVTDTHGGGGGGGTPHVPPQKTLQNCNIKMQ